MYPGAVIFSAVCGISFNSHSNCEYKVHGALNLWFTNLILTVCSANQSKVFFVLHPTAAGQPGNLAAVPAGPTSFTVSWTAPTSGADVTGYQINWSGGSHQGSMNASAGDTAVTISGRSPGLVYTISIMALSDQLPSPQVGPVPVTLGE